MDSALFVFVGTYLNLNNPGLFCLIQWEDTKPLLKLFRKETYLC